MNKKNKEKKFKNQRSFYFQDYNYNPESKDDSKKLNINEDRVYLLFFVFFCLISIFTIKILITSLQSPFSKYNLQNYGAFKPHRSDILDRNGEAIAKNISVYDVLNASSTKWNFLKYQPGLVGGHCIGVDPYYLAHKSSKLKIDPKVILSGRKTNNEMPTFIAKRIDEKLKRKSKILFLGLTFKEDVPDLRNSKSFEIISFLKNKQHTLKLHDPYVKSDDLQLVNLKKIKNNSFDAFILAVPHKFYLQRMDSIKNLLKSDGIFFDIKGKVSSKRDKYLNYWSL